MVRRHLHLLTDSTLEFEGELEAERLRRQVVESVRRNELVEGYVEGLDVKIALLVKNKITLDEVVKHQKHFGGSASQLLRNGSTLASGHHGGSGLDLKALNKSSRKKLTGYEELFFLLQTQPQYLARLFRATNGEGVAGERRQKFGTVDVDAVWLRAEESGGVFVAQAPGVRDAADGVAGAESGRVSALAECRVPPAPTAELRPQPQGSRLPEAIARCIGQGGHLRARASGSRERSSANLPRHPE